MKIHGSSLGLAESGVKMGARAYGNAGNRYRLEQKQLRELQILVEEHENVIYNAWNTHFGSDKH